MATLGNALSDLFTKELGATLLKLRKDQFDWEQYCGIREAVTPTVIADVIETINHFLTNIELTLHSPIPDLKQATAVYDGDGILAPQDRKLLLDALSVLFSNFHPLDPRLSDHTDSAKPSGDSSARLKSFFSVSSAFLLAIKVVALLDAMQIGKLLKRGTKESENERRLQDQLGDAKGQLDLAKKRIVELEKEMAIAKAAADRELQAAKKAKSDLEERLMQVNQSLMQANSEKEQQIQHLQSRLRVEKERNEEIGLQVVHQRKQLNHVQFLLDKAELHQKDAVTREKERGRKLLHVLVREDEMLRRTSQRVSEMSSWLQRSTTPTGALISPPSQPSADDSNSETVYERMRAELVGRLEKDFDELSDKRRGQFAKILEEYEQKVKQRQAELQDLQNQVHTKQLELGLANRNLAARKEAEQAPAGKIRIARMPDTVSVSSFTRERSAQQTPVPPASPASRPCQGNVRVSIGRSRAEVLPVRSGSARSISQTVSSRTSSPDIDR